MRLGALAPQVRRSMRLAKGTKEQLAVFRGEIHRGSRPARKVTTLLMVNSLHELALDSTRSANVARHFAANDRTRRVLLRESHARV